MSTMKASVLLCMLFLVAGCLLNRPPAAPTTPKGPILVHQNKYAVYTSSTTDPDGDRVSLGVCCTSVDSSPGEIPYWSYMVGSGDTLGIETYFRDCGTFRVWMRARDEHGRESGWSEPLTVTCVPESSLTQ
jgi:hypothetical protein